ncbi:MAG: small ribosomal subunit biogenesis GTPase RsgA [Pseudomonadales bacterium]|nr:small ribosomal subunit biogenesis GTPase RsgA [Pseudomonadales bacterium]
MAKRHLTRRQLWRIKKVQDERVKRSEARDTAIDHKLETSQLGPERQGLVIAHYGAQVAVEGLDGNTAGVHYRCHLRANLNTIVTGDQVIWRAIDEQTGVIVAKLERQSELARPDTNGLLRPIAANIDQIFIVIASQPMTPLGLIDRYLVAAETVSIQPLILINKADLLKGKEKEQMLDIIKLYEKIGYKCITTSTKSETGLTSLNKSLVAHTSIFVGQSGVGKSSLINAILPNANLRTAALSDATGKGTHTTTTAYLYHLPTGGNIIDSPGIREFGLTHISDEELIEGFIEFRPYFGHCKFRDCKHLKEPGCALIAAVNTGSIDPRRMTSFRSIANSL